MAIQYPSYSTGADPNGMFDAFGQSFGFFRGLRDERRDKEAFNKFADGLAQQQSPRPQPMSLASLGQNQPQQRPLQTYAPQEPTDAPTQRIQSALGETGDREKQAMQFYIGKGYTPHQAAGIVGNLIQESNLNTGALNPGDGADGSNSVGIGQWNGPRAQALHAFAQQNGADPSDFNTQLAFVEHELNGSEKGVGERLRAAQNPIEAAAAFVGYERPQGWTADNPYGAHGWGNRAKHSARLAGGNYAPGQATPVQMADASGQVGVPQQAIGQQQLLPLPDAETMKALFASPGTRPLAIALAKGRIDAQQNAGDPMARLKYETAQLEMQKLRKELGGAGGEFKVVGDQLVRIGPDGAISDVTPGAASGSNGFRFEGKSVEAQALNGLMDAGTITPEQAQQLGAGKTITGPNGEIIFMTPQGVFSKQGGNAPQPVASQPDGNIQITEPKVTIDEKKAMTFADRMTKSGSIIDGMGTRGSGMGDKLASKAPFGLDVYATSDDFKKVDQAKRDFINAQLRRESGAVISNEEFDNANKQYFPQPNDPPEVVEQKRQNRQLVIDGMQRDSGPTYKAKGGANYKDKYGLD